MYKVNFKMIVWDGQTLVDIKKMATVSKEIELTFPPFMGLKINFPAKQDWAAETKFDYGSWRDFRDWEIKGVSWHVETSAFCCVLEELFCGYHPNLPAFDQVLETFEINGWTISDSE